VLAAGEGSHQSLEALCRQYWYPLYAFLRRRGYGRHDAEDLTQGFFLLLLRRRDISQARPQKGRFRTFLMTSLRHYISDEGSRARAAKRGGGRRVLPMELQDAEARYSLEPKHGLTPERLFDRRWAMTAIDQSLENLRQRYRRENKEPLFEALKGRLIESPGHPSHAQMAATLAMTEGAVKVAVHRLRRRFRQLLQDAVAQTVSSPAQVEDELRSLLTALRS